MTGKKSPLLFGPEKKAIYSAGHIYYIIKLVNSSETVGRKELCIFSLN